MTIQIGRLVQYYAKEEASYGTAPVFASTDAVRFLDVDLMWDQKSRRNAPDRILTPDLERRFTGREQASFDVKPSLMWPSGTIGTAPESDIWFKNALGTKTNAGATTTVSAATTPTTTQFSVTSPTNIAVGTAVVVNVTGAGNCMRWVTALATNLATVAPALPSAPTTGDTVKGACGYSPATNPAKSIDLGAYLNTNSTAFTREQLGCVVDKMGLMFDANEEPKLSFGGPSKTQLRGTAQALPAAFTTVGTAIPSGITGSLRIGSAAYLMLKAGVNLTNNMAVRNAEFGVSSASGFYRKGRRVVEVAIDCYVEDPTVIYANGESATALQVLIQCGTTEGQIWGVYLPRVEFQMPQTPTNEDELVWSFKGVALGTSGNDEIYVAQG